MRVKSIHLLCILALSTLSVFAGSKQKPLPEATSKGAFFRENKGQVKDQNWQPRPDVLFSGEANGLAYHLKKDGLHYQLSKVDSWKEETEMRKAPGMEKDAHKVPDQISMYRVDVRWLGANPFCEIITGEARPDYENFYNVPEGVEPALFVKSYASVTYKNLYENIDLKFYQTPDGELEYDFIVHPGGDYKKIQLDIQGATLSLNENQELALTTPLGTITEGALRVHQEGKNIPASWVLQNATTVNYQIESYNSAEDLIIDPPVRLWGTYYGGSDDDYVYSCTTDASGNVYLAGWTRSTTAIATSGAHQTTLDGYSDAYLVKFDASGTRLWGTYYGGSDDDLGYSCTTDASGNVCLAGYTGSTNAISTTGAHQTTNGGNGDAFLVKFDASGTLLWGTYYGGSGYDFGMSCTTDASGNVYLAGFAYSTNAIATSGAHQTTQGGVGYNDAFLVKFDASGTRLWGTYYGGNSSDYGYSCTTDASGNVYLAGITESTTAIATSGGHQTSLGGNYDAFLVKFDASGSRLWGTYYGGSDSEYYGFCSTDASGNVYLAGYTYSTNAIVTSGAHQTTHGGNSDAFLVKFDASGTRLWGTYYGGSDSDDGNSCTTDASGNVYLAGYTYNSNAIATSGAHQTTLDGYSDAYLVKFDASGTRLWGTYYGGSDSEYYGFCSTDASGNVYLAGYTYSTNAIVTSGAHQTTHGDGGIYYDAFLVKFDGSIIADAGPDITLCSGAQATMAANQPTNTTGNWTKIQGSGVVVNPSSATSQVTGLGNGNSSIFVWTITDGNSSYSDTMVMTVLAKPTALNTISVSSNSAQIEWSSAIDPDSFLIRYQKNCTGTNYYAWVSGTLRTATLTGLNPCATYCFRVRSQCTNAPLPQYSATNGTFTTSAGASCVAVTNVAIANSSACNYTVSWSNCVLADSFRVRYKLSSASVWSFSPWTASYSATVPMGPGSWMVRVQSKCGTTIYSTGTTNYTIGSCRTAGVSEELVSNLVLFPNPATERSLLNFTSFEEGDYTITVKDISGRTLRTITGSAVTGENTAEINVNGLSIGLYLVGLTLNGETRQVKLTVE
jgi:hypothetical protein